MKSSVRNRIEPSNFFKDQILDNIIKIMGEALFVTDSDGNIEVVNQRTLSLLGYEEQELIGNSVNKIFSEDCPEGKWENFWTIKRLIRDILVHNYYMILLSKKGKNIPISFSGAVIRNNRRKIQGIVGIARDVSETKRFSSQFEVAEEILKETESQKIDEVKYSQSEMNDKYNIVIGDSPKMKSIMTLARKVADTKTTVLIQGESGTGKELVARAIRNLGSRKDRPFIAVNCASIPETLLESELFGHEKGAFTDACRLKRGKIELARGGTLFLDEIADLKASLQGKLLRVIQENEFERVGGTKTIKIDFRLIAATNKNLYKAVQEGTFREDLYYRLNVISLFLPPLRDRKEDLPVLTAFFLEKYCKETKKKIMKVSKEAMKIFQGYHWPGNVRELENFIERAVILGSDTEITPKDFLFETSLDNKFNSNKLYHEMLKNYKREIIRNSLLNTKGNVTKAAHLLGLQPTYLFRLIKTLRIK